MPKKKSRKIDLTFVVPEEHLAITSVVVVDALFQMNIYFDYDEVSPTNENNEATYKVVGVKL